MNLLLEDVLSKKWKQEGVEAANDLGLDYRNNHCCCGRSCYDFSYLGFMDKGTIQTETKKS
jgi:hypothetical protein